MDFEAFLREQLPGLLRFAGALTGDAELAQDLTQDALIRAHARWGRIGRLDRPDLYLRRMITNGHRSFWRPAITRATRPVADATALVAAIAPDPAERLADRDQVEGLLATLSPRRCAVLVLRFFEDRRAAEIAAVLGCSAGTVRSHVSRALAGLRAHLEPEVTEQ